MTRKPKLNARERKPGAVVREGTFILRTFSSLTKAQFIVDFLNEHWGVEYSDQAWQDADRAFHASGIVEPPPPPPDIPLVAGWFSRKGEVCAAVFRENAMSHPMEKCLSIEEAEFKAEFCNKRFSGVFTSDERSAAMAAWVEVRDTMTLHTRPDGGESPPVDQLPLFSNRFA